MLGHLGKQQNKRLPLRLGHIHVVDPELMEIARDDVLRPLTDRQCLVVLESLLIDALEGAPMPFIRFIQCDAARLLLDHHAHGRNPRIDIERIPLLFMLACVFEADVLLRILHAKDITQEREPEWRGLPVLLALSAPVLHKFLHFLLLFIGRHHQSPHHFHHDFCFSYYSMERGKNRGGVPLEARKKRQLRTASLSGST